MKTGKLRGNFARACLRIFLRKTHNPLTLFGATAVKPLHDYPPVRKQSKPCNGSVSYVSGNVAVSPSSDVGNVVGLFRCTAKLTPVLCEASYGKPMSLPKTLLPTCNPISASLL